MKQDLETKKEKEEEKLKIVGGAALQGRGRTNKGSKREVLFFFALGGEKFF